MKVNVTQINNLLGLSLDNGEISKIKDSEKKIYEEIKSSNPEIIESINNTGKLEEETEKKLMSIITEFKKNNK